MAACAAGVACPSVGVGAATAGATVVVAAAAVGAIHVANFAEGVKHARSEGEERGSGGGEDGRTGTGKATSSEKGPLNPAETAVYRGGTDMTFTPNEVRLDAKGMVKPTHGLSVNTNAAGLERFGGAQQIKTIPEGLQIIQRGSNQNHFEIVPTQPMKPEQFQLLLNKVEFHRP